METCKQSHEGITKYGPLTGEQMERRAKVRGLLALVSATKDDKKRMVLVNRDFNAATNIKRCAVIERSPPELTRENFVRQPLNVELREKQLEAVVGDRSKKAGRHLHVSWRFRVYGVFATTVHCWRQRFAFERRSLLVCGAGSFLSAISNLLARICRRLELTR